MKNFAFTKWSASDANQRSVSNIQYSSDGTSRVLTCTPVFSTRACQLATSLLSVTHRDYRQRRRHFSVSIMFTVLKAEMWSRSRGLGLETISRTKNVSVSCYFMSLVETFCGVRAVWRSTVVVVPYRPICLSP